MAIVDDLTSDVSSILAATLDLADGTVIPETDDITLQDGGRKLDVVMLYADLADSTALVTYNRQVAAKIFKAFLACCTRLILHNDGYVRSFDGDRVMGVFIGERMNSRAAKTALQIKWAFKEVLKPKLDARYEKVRDGTVVIEYCAGVASGEVLVVRAGMRGTNDLLWVGRAANIAAKLSELRKTPYNAFITEAVYKILAGEVKSTDGKDMWTKFNPYGDAGVIYGSSWQWRP